MLALHSCTAVSLSDIKDVAQQTWGYPMSDSLTAEAHLIEQLRRVLAPATKQRLRAGEVDALIGGSRTFGWEVRKRPGFPRPLVLGRNLRLWDRDEVVAWLEAQRAPESGDARPRGKGLAR